MELPDIKPLKILSSNEMHYFDLLDKIVDNRHDGFLRITQGPQEGYILFKNGTQVASSYIEYLGEKTDRDMVNKEYFKEAAIQQIEKNIVAGKKYLNEVCELNNSQMDYAIELNPNCLIEANNKEKTNINSTETDSSSVSTLETPENTNAKDQTTSITETVPIPDVSKTKPVNSEVIPPENTTISEPSASESTTPEPTVSEPTVSESTVSESITPEPTTPESTTPESTTPETNTPEPTTPEPTVSEPTTPEPTTPEPTTPEPTTPEPTVSEPTVSEPIVPEPTTSESTILKSTHPKRVIPHPKKIKRKKDLDKKQDIIETSKSLVLTDEEIEDLEAITAHKIENALLQIPNILDLECDIILNDGEKIEGAAYIILEYKSAGFLNWIIGSKREVTDIEIEIIKTARNQIKTIFNGFKDKKFHDIESNFDFKVEMSRK